MPVCEGCTAGAEEAAGPADSAGPADPADFAGDGASASARTAAPPRGRMAVVNTLLDAAPPALRERLLVEFVGLLQRPTW